ncbi:calcium-binding protein [Defluviimonas salinarum]|uniref:Hemolysin-type calcium-binding repeat-containing protein n=1 Tax=Defluviimonas salinarum TaxID=2992147 RepID=A0ABT3JAP3_9RHOB|nr:calcium-binding protein [Defluviimonas salinarum]MCW3784762.1 hypothetical protein [Defluviimonas salinarum]
MSNVAVFKFKFDTECKGYVGSAAFGANLIFAGSKSNTTSGADISTLGVTAFRYPGGSVTERHFDYRNPNIAVNDSSLHYDNDPSTTPTALAVDKFVPLSEFLSIEEQAGRLATFVLPTRNFVTRSVPEGDQPRPVNNVAISDFKAFLSSLLASPSTDGKKHAIDGIKAFEIGNEYWGSGEMTSSEYGKVVSAVIKAANEVFSEAGISRNERPDFIVQMGAPWGAEFKSGGKYDNMSRDYINGLMAKYNMTSSDFTASGELKWDAKVKLSNLDIISNLSAEARGSISGVTEHFYYTKSDDVFAQTSHSLNYIDVDYSIWKHFLGYNIDLHITEWNIKSSNTQMLGLAGAGALIEQFEYMVRLGAKSAFVWPYQLNTANDLGDMRGDVQSLSPLGAAYKLMSDSLVGTYLLESNISGGDLEVNAYYSSEKFVFFASSRSDISKSISLDFSDIVSTYDTISGVKIGVDLSTSDGRHWTPSGVVQVDYYREHDVKALLTQYSERDLGSASNITFSLDPYEVIRIEFNLHKSSRFIGSPGSDIWSGGLGYDSAQGGGGGDTLLGHLGNDTLDGGDGDDILNGGIGHDLLSGGAGCDYIFGGNDNDTISGGGGRDKVFGGAGNDHCYGGKDGDCIYGADGDDVIYGEDGKDQIFGGNGSDQMYGGADNDQLYGGSDNDWIYGGNDNDQIYGGNGNDRLFGQSGNDVIYGGNGSDAIFGGDGHDRLYGGIDNNQIYGGNGCDRIFGGLGNDTISGGEGDDWLFGMKGDDLIHGGGGSDWFVFYAGFGEDVIVDFKDNVDTIILSRALWGGANLTPAQVLSEFSTVIGASATFDFGTGDTVTVRGVHSANQIIDDLQFI